MVSDERRAGARRDSRDESARRSCRASRPSRTGPYLIGQCSDVAAQLCIPDSPRPVPTLIYMHGGGWMLGDYTSVDELTRTLENPSGWQVALKCGKFAPRAALKHRSPLGGAMNASESVDGKYLYIRRGVGDAGDLHRVRIDGSEDVKLLNAVRRRFLTVFRQGIYFHRGRTPAWNSDTSTLRQAPSAVSPR